MNLPPFSEIKATLLAWITTQGQAKQIVEGDDTVIVPTEGGDVPSYRRAQKLLGEQIVALFSTIQDWNGATEIESAEVPGTFTGGAGNNAVFSASNQLDNNGWTFQIAEGSSEFYQERRDLRIVFMQVLTGTTLDDIQTKMTALGIPADFQFQWNGAAGTAITDTDFGPTAGGASQVDVPDIADTAGQMFRVQSPVTLNKTYLPPGSIIRYTGSDIDIINIAGPSLESSIKIVRIPPEQTELILSDSTITQDTHFIIDGDPPRLEITFENGDWVKAGREISFTQTGDRQIFISIGSSQSETLIPEAYDSLLTNGEGERLKLTFIDEVFYLVKKI